MKRKRAIGEHKHKTNLGKKKPENDTALVAENGANNNSEAGKPETNIQNYPSGLREMIVSIIKEISKEPGVLASLSRNLVDNPVSNGQVAQPHNDMVLEENKSQLPQSPEHKQQELKAALTVIKNTMKLDAADPFNRPVDPVALEIPDYFDVIETPMDFGTICSNLENGVKYKNSADVHKDVEYIWYNCIKYNKKGDHILELMDRVKAFFMKYWIAARLHTEQSTSVEAGLHNEEHSGSPVTPVAETAYRLAPLAENDPIPSNIQTAEPEQSSSQSQSSPEQDDDDGDGDDDDDEPNTDAAIAQKKRQGRGPTRCLKLLNTVGKIKVATNELGQPVGREASLLTSFLGLTARDGKLAPLIYSSWSKMPSENKEDMWQKVLTKFEINESSRNWVLRSLGSKWRNFKSLLKATHYDIHATDEQRLADRDERVLPDQWSVLVSQWSSEKWQSISAKNKANRSKQRFNHTSGKKSFARIREEEKAKRPDGQEPSRAELFILTRTRKNGQPVNEETAAVISQLRDSTTPKEVTPINKNEPEDEACNRVIGIGPLYGLSARPGAEGPTRAQALKMVTEKNAEVVEMKEKLASMEQMCSQMAAQMSAMVSMMATMQKESAAQILPNAVAGTLVPVGIPYASEPIAVSNHEVPVKKLGFFYIYIDS